MASTLTQSVCDLLKGKYTDVNKLQTIPALAPSLSPDSQEEKQLTIEEIKKEKILINTYILNLHNDIIPGYYHQYNNSSPFLPKIKKIITILLEDKKITLPTDINIDIDNLFNNNNTNTKIEQLHTNYIKVIKNIWQNKKYNFYTKIYNIYNIILLIEKFIKKKQLSVKKGGFNKNNSKKTIKKQSKNNKKTIKKIIKKTIKKKCKTIKGLYLYKIYDIGNYNDGDLDKNNKKKEYTIWDCAKGFVICARNENNARQLITNNKNELTVGDEINYRKDFWLNSSFTKCESIGHSCLSKEQIILRDFQDG